MKQELVQELYKALNKEYLKRLLVEYFSKKGYKENFDRPINPLAVQDLMQAIPQLQEKIEIVPYVENIDPTTGRIVLKWNMFLFGHQRMDLGKTKHESLSELQTMTSSKQPSHVSGFSTPKRITEFIIKVFGEDQDGDILSVKNNMSTPSRSLFPMAVGDSAGMFRSRFSA